MSIWAWIGLALQVWLITPVLWFTQEHNREMKR